MILPIGTTVAVADGKTIRMFHNTGVKPGVHLVEITAASPVRFPTSSSARAHVGVVNFQGRRLVEDDFAAITAAFLNKLCLDGTIEHLVVVSDPRTLGKMRKHFHGDLKGKIIGELPNDFSGRPLEDIASLIADA
ncbi:host cell attachment protein [Bradyrhizobium pachyrhizi]|uniref:baeRF12 domain-containing protein n=1 Tax=Bradyrhizobium pachyrhizi TaxID=280333 RepID=UPI000704B9B9|nr:host attachment protein [Bradyrhizobium pachyrhizi]KRQ11288.1 host cell attachment protein [Bradyrhizobium pachyrhizi]